LYINHISHATWNVLHHMPPRYENHKSLPSTTNCWWAFKVAAAFRDVLPLYAAGFLLEQEFLGIKSTLSLWYSNFSICWIFSMKNWKKMVRPWDPAILWGRKTTWKLIQIGCHLVSGRQGPSPKFNSSPPEKLPGWAPIGKERIYSLPTNHHFSGANLLLNFGDVKFWSTKKWKIELQGQTVVKLPGC